MLEARRSWEPAMEEAGGEMAILGEVDGTGDVHADVGFEAGELGGIEDLGGDTEGAGLLRRFLIPPRGCGRTCRAWRRPRSTRPKSSPSLRASSMNAVRLARLRSRIRGADLRTCSGVEAFQKFQAQRSRSGQVGA